MKKAVTKCSATRANLEHREGNHPSKSHKSIVAFIATGLYVAAAGTLPGMTRSKMKP